MSHLMRGLMRRYMENETNENGNPGAGAGSKPNTVLSVPDELVPEGWKDAVRELRREHKKFREERETREAEYASKLKAELEKQAQEFEGKLKSTQTAADERFLRAELKAIAAKEGMIDLDGLKLADLSAVKIKEDGSIDGAEAVFKGLKESKPYLFGVPNTSSNTQQKTPPAKTEAKKATDMDDSEYAAAKAALLK